MARASKRACTKGTSPKLGAAARRVPRARSWRFRRQVCAPWRAPPGRAGCVRSRQTPVPSESGRTGEGNSASAGGRIEGWGRGQRRDGGLGLRQLSQDIGVALRQRNERARCTRGLLAALLPALQCAHRNAQELRELGLR